MRWLAVALLVGCGPHAPSGSLLLEPFQPFPETMEGVGLYPRAPDLDAVPPQAVPYAPRWPLWSNGLDKQRYAVLPGDAVVEAGDTWAFPEGTLLFKTFSWEGEPVETRVMRRAEDGLWDFAAYLWDGERAALLDGDRPTEVDAVDHTVPAVIECRACHESSPATVLGFSEVQVDPGQVADLLDDVPADPDVIPPGDDQGVLGLFAWNCTHCHNGWTGPNSAFDLRHDVAVDNIVDQPTQGSASGTGVRVVPGDPGASVLFLAYSGEGDDPEIADMPPLGVDVRDAEGIETLRQWILSL